MGLLDAISSFFITEAYAEEQQDDDKEEQSSAGGDDDSGEESKGDEGGEESSEGRGEEGGDEEGGGDEGGEGGGDDEEEEDEEEEEEPEDVKPHLEEKCANSPECRPFKHEYEECAERVHKWEEDENAKGEKESCVEEFFEYVHCSSQCAANKLFKQLK